MARLPRNKKQIYRLNSMPQIWALGLTLAMTLILTFQAQIFEFATFAKNGRIVTKWKANINRTGGHKCEHWVWSWLWHWPWIFKVKYGICYISAKNDRIATKNESKYIDWTRDLKVECEHWVWPWVWPWKTMCKELLDSDFSCQRTVDSSSS